MEESSNQTQVQGVCERFTLNKIEVMESFYMERFSMGQVVFEIY